MINSIPVSRSIREDVERGIVVESGWFLSKVTIEDPIRERTYDIQCNSWLSSRSNDQKTMRDFTVTSTVLQRQHSDASTFASDRSRNSTNERRKSSPSADSPPPPPPPPPASRPVAKSIDSPVISRSPSPPASRRNTYTRTRSSSPPVDHSRLTSATTSDRTFQPKKSTDERDESPAEDQHRPPSRLETRSPPRPAPMVKKRDDDAQEEYDHDFYN